MQPQPHPNAEDLMDFDADGFCLTADGKPFLHRSKIGAVANDTKNRSMENRMFPSGDETGYREGDTLVCYADFGFLSGTAGYLLVRDRRVVAKRATMMS